MATYNILQYKNLIPTYQLIFRNLIHLEQELQMIGQVTKYPHIEFDQVKIGGVFNIRNCSIKPHGCENYDFDFRINKRFIITRGMDEKLFNYFECVMPTILYTLHDRSPIRFKGTLDMKELITISGKNLENFFFLYEHHNF